jgi:hypothetical protein
MNALNQHGKTHTSTIRTAGPDSVSRHIEELDPPEMALTTRP